MFGLVVAGAFAGAGWYLSDVLKDGALVPNRDDPELDLEVIALGDGHVTLRPKGDADPADDWQANGIWGLQAGSAYGQLGSVVEAADGQVVREYTQLNGGIGPGAEVRIDSYAFPGNPHDAFGLAFEEVWFASPVGDFAAWYVQGHRDTWVLFVHGRGADRREALRMLPTIAELGFPSLTITYRNDAGALPSSDGFYRYGQTEWEELHGAAAYAIDQGADRLILVGYSMGGGIVMSFLYQSALADRVDAAILDAPMLSFSSAVEQGARQRGYPGLFTSLAKLFATARFGIDWQRVDYLRRADELSVPLLLFHGDSDPVVPVEDSDFLAEARPDLTQYVRTENVGHVRSWNTNREAYEAAVRDFLGSFGR